VNDVRVFKGRDSTGVRGIKLEKDDHVISMAVIRHVDATAEERLAFLKMSRAVAGEDVEPETSDEEEVVDAGLSQERYAAMGAAEQVILTVSSNGYGKRTSSFEYRITNRGGKGIVAMAVNERNGPLVASFPVEHSDQIMLVTDGGQLIRCPIGGIRKAGRSTQGVIVIDTADDEHVVSVRSSARRRGRNRIGNRQACRSNVAVLQFSAKFLVCRSIVRFFGIDDLRKLVAFIARPRSPSCRGRRLP
jgi:DNA gyrase subunit A